MKCAVHSYLFVLIFVAAFCHAQDSAQSGPHDYFEVKGGEELNRNVLSFGFGRKFYVGKDFSLAPEITVLGVPFFCGTIRQDIRLNSQMRLTPQLGLGLSSAGFIATETFILGGDWSYQISTNLTMFVECRVYFVNKNVIGMGTGILEIDHLDNHKPVVLTLGLGF